MQNNVILPCWDCTVFGHTVFESLFAVLEYYYHIDYQMILNSLPWGRLSGLQSQGWQLTLRVASCLIRWFACIEKKNVIMHDTECPDWDHFSLITQNSKLSLAVLEYCYRINSYSASHDNCCTGTLLNSIITAQWEGMGDVGSARYKPALLPPCPTIRVLSYSNCQRSTQSHQQSKG